LVLAQKSAGLLFCAKTLPSAGLTPIIFSMGNLGSPYDAPTASGLLPPPNRRLQERLCLPCSV